MAEVTALRNNALPYPVYGAPFTVVLPILDKTGALVSGAAGLDSEISKNGDTPADCTNEATEIGSSGEYYLTLTGAELTADIVAAVIKTSTTDAKNTPFVLYPRKLVTIRSGTAASGGSATDTIVFDAGASAEDDFYNGMLVIATIDGNVEARIISDYVGSSKTASVVPDWNVPPDNNDTFVVKLPEGWQLHQANVTHYGGVSGTFASGRPAVNTTHINATAQTARDLGASVLLSSGTGAGQISLSSGAVLLQATQTGVTIPTVTTLTNAPPDSSGVTTLLSRIPSTLFSGITSLAQWLGLLAGKQTGNATARTELRATGAGSGTYDETTDSQEAARDNMGTAQTGDTFARLGAPAGASVSADLADIEDKVDDLEGRLTATRAGYLDNLSAGGVAQASALAAVKTVTDKIDTALEADGASGYQFTELALENAPAGGGGGGGTDWDATERAQIRHRLGLDGSASAPAATPSLSTAAALQTVDDLVDDLETRLTSGRAAALDNLDATVSSRATPAQVNTEADQALADVGLTTTITGRVDAAVSSRLASAGYTAPDNTTIATINSKLGAFTASGLNTVLGVLRALLRKDASLTPSDVGGAYDNTTDSLEALKDNQLDAAISSRATPAQVNAETDQALADVGLTGTVTSRIDVATSSRLAAGSYTSPLDAAGMRAAVGLSAASLDTQLANVPTAAQNADALLDRASAVETGVTPRGALRLMLAALAGKLSGAGTSTVTVRNVGDSKNRIQATVDADGNRAAVTTDVS